MEIQHINQENKGRFKVIDKDIVAGEITYSWAGDDKFIIDHTEVNPKFKGQGIGKKLLLSAVEFARKEKKKIIPLCPFAKAVFDKNTDLNDVL